MFIRFKGSVLQTRWKSRKLFFINWTFLNLNFPMTAKRFEKKNHSGKFREIKEVKSKISPAKYAWNFKGGNTIDDQNEQSNKRFVKRDEESWKSLKSFMKNIGRNREEDEMERLICIHGT